MVGSVCLIHLGLSDIFIPCNESYIDGYGSKFKISAALKERLQEWQGAVENDLLVSCKEESHRPQKGRRFL